MAANLPLLAKSQSRLTTDLFSDHRSLFTNSFMPFMPAVSARRTTFVDGGLADHSIILTVWDYGTAQGRRSGSVAWSRGLVSERVASGTSVAALCRVADPATRYTCSP
jgi:hypothetical protein